MLVVLEISSWTDDTHTQTHTQIQTYSSQYFATTPAGEIIKHAKVWLTCHHTGVCNWQSRIKLIINVNYNKAIIDDTSLTLCTPIPPSRLIWNHPFCSECRSEERSYLLHDVTGDWIIPFAADALQCIVSGEENPSKVPLSLGISSPCQRSTEP